MTGVLEPARLCVCLGALNALGYYELRLLRATSCASRLAVKAVRTQLGNTALLAAATGSGPDAVQVLLELGANREARRGVSPGIARPRRPRTQGVARAKRSAEASLCRPSLTRPERTASGRRQERDWACAGVCWLGGNRLAACGMSTLPRVAVVCALAIGCGPSAQAGGTALNHAAANGKTAIVKLLLDNGAQVDAKGEVRTSAAEHELVNRPPPCWLRLPHVAVSRSEGLQTQRGASALRDDLGSSVACVPLASARQQVRTGTPGCAPCHWLLPKPSVPSPL